MRFRIRSLLLLMAVVGVLTVVSLHYYRRYSALCLIAAGGGDVYFIDSRGQFQQDQAWRGAFRRVEMINVPPAFSNSAMQEVLKQLTDVRKVCFYGEEMNEDTATMFGKLPNLEEFELMSGQQEVVNARELKAICQAPRLRSVFLFAPAERGHFSAMGLNPSLTKIHVTGYVTNVGLESLVERPRLEEVSFAIHRDSLRNESIEALLERHPGVKLTCRGDDGRGKAWWEELRERFPEAEIVRN